MGISVKVKNENNIPNADTVAAMNELKAGKGIRFNNVKSLLVISELPESLLFVLYPGAFAHIFYASSN
ncbi:hypothetical protein GCM10022210_37440 [Mucilaginibacter dorajii]|uniref:Uncharacterized protein n=2 Tax=Mucilaginibacter dorajii TaxID=692994 RepID=A0ABP7QHY9_9SPHI